MGAYSEGPRRDDMDRISELLMMGDSIMKTVTKAIENNDDYSFENEEYEYYNSEHPRFSAKVILKCNMFSDTTFENCELKFDCKKTVITSNKQNPIQDNGTYDVTFDNINDFNNPDKITWSIKMSDPDDETGQYQIDDDAKNIGISFAM